jgi:hypothetical protein
LTSTATSTTTRATTATSTRATTGRARAPRKARAERAAYGLWLLVACTTFLFAGTSIPALTVPAFLLAILVVVYTPWRAAGPAPPLHAWLKVLAIVMVLQLVPLPAALVDRISPGDRAVWQSLSLTPVLGALPLSVDLTATILAIAIGGGAMLLFVVSGRIFADGGVRIAVRGIAAVGLLLAAESLAQDATAHGLIYWRWDPGEGPPPFGPYLNRNHFATWMVIAIPLCLGYLVAHASVHGGREGAALTWRRRVAAALDGRSIWLAAAICLMLVALVASLSRSGMIGLTAALALALYLRRHRAGPSRAGWAIGAIGIALVGVALRVNVREVLDRFGAAGVAAAYRMNIWRETLPVVRRFWLTGSGVGTIETVMLVNQHAPSLFRINAAHNHYLQVAAEGGLLIGIPVAMALALFVRAAHDALTRDASGMYFLRAGAVSGLFGVAVQSVWETGLTNPANAVLAAIAAAIAVHRSTPRVRPEA